MESQSNQPPVIAIVGETASGKSRLALRLAQLFNGEIICADSRTIYRGMDIGTAKPSRDDQAKVPHHLIDVVDPDERFTAAQFQALAQQAIADITVRGRLPFLVGGTGLYVNSVLFDFGFAGEADPAVRARLEQFSTPDLQRMLLARGHALPQNEQNRRHLIRALETNGLRPAAKSLRSNTLILGTKVTREKLRMNIEVRLAAMLAAGFVAEAKCLSEKYGWQAPGLQTANYQALRSYIQGELSFESAKERCVFADLHLAKRQRTWFRRNKSIQWLEDQEHSVDILTTFLNKL